MPSLIHVGLELFHLSAAEHDIQGAAFGAPLAFEERLVSDKVEVYHGSATLPIVPPASYCVVVATGKLLIGLCPISHLCGRSLAWSRTSAFHGQWPEDRRGPGFNSRR